MKPYADTNFFTNIHLDLPQTEQADELLTQISALSNNLLPVTWLIRLEYANALERFVFETRKGANHRVTPESAAAAHAQFDEQLRNETHMHDVVLPLLTVIDSCH